MASVVDAFLLSGLSFLNKASSPIKGGDGNTEYLLHFFRLGSGDRGSGEK